MRIITRYFVSYVSLAGVALGASILFFACSKSKGIGDDPIQEKQVDIYVAGYTGPLNGPFTAQYWKNGELIKLTDGSTRAIVTDIFVEKGDVYVAGTITITGKGERAVYWKNGQRMDLAVDQGVYTRASAIGVAKGKVYVAGVENADAVYWVDGEIHRLPSSDDYTLSPYFAIHVTDKEDIYIAAMVTKSVPQIDDKVQVVKYWKNNVEHIVASPAKHHFGHVGGLFVDGEDIYIAGNYQNSGGIGWAKYWKNKEEYTLTENVSGGSAYDIYVKNGNVHVIGSGQGGMPLYWKNGKEKPLEMKGKGYGSFNAIAVHNDDVYIAGAVSNDDGDWDIGGYWTNGKWHALETAKKDNYTTVTSMFIVER
ncbi:hypothetical protein [Sphingobacterium paucimobilis]|uniref:hypothetical protein n=1 Tax=Sphingobacterium paucimobilis TaxID=1385985 RepID=UPI00118229D3|nr:hypothetical protein [Sphingobacterium paucimobilis]